jgi:hypothetical protein
MLDEPSGEPRGHALGLFQFRCSPKETPRPLSSMICLLPADDMAVADMAVDRKIARGCAKLKALINQRGRHRCAIVSYVMPGADSRHRFLGLSNPIVVPCGTSSKPVELLPPAARV